MRHIRIERATLVDGVHRPVGRLIEVGDGIDAETADLLVRNHIADDLPEEAIADYVEPAEPVVAPPADDDA
jgi:hypothetical protein